MQAVLQTTLVETAEALQLGFIHGDDELAADFVGDAVVAAEGGHFLDAGDGEAGLQGAGLVIEAGVEDAAVVAGLVKANAGFFFENDNLTAGKTGGELEGGGQADDAAADDDEVFEGQGGEGKL